jgi:hypothetical protein
MNLEIKNAAEVLGIKNIVYSKQTYKAISLFRENQG